MWNFVTTAVILEIFVVCGPESVYGIIGGHDSTINRHRWLVSLQNNSTHICGATLISKDWVLTSAQCVTKFSNFTIRAASNHTTIGGEVYEVEKVIVHPDYNNKNFDADIALLKLTEAITTNFVLFVNLPYNDNVVEEYSPATIAGWGSIEPNGGLTDMIQMVQIPAQTLQQCRCYYSEEAVVTENMFCAGYPFVGNKTSCKGDYGGPVIVYARLAGIQSWGWGCGIPKWPTVFVRVANYLDWIKANTGIGTPRIKYDVCK